MPCLVHVLGQVLGHALGQRGDERAVALLRRLALHSSMHVVDLVSVDRADFDRRIDQAGRADDLFGEDAAGLLHLPGPGVAETNRLRAHRVPFLEAQRAVVDAGGQAEAVFGQRRFAPEVAARHAPICGMV
jgi:hypothetical protein